MLEVLVLAQKQGIGDILKISKEKFGSEIITKRKNLEKKEYGFNRQLNLK